ncbi:hypothetical protein [Nonomuraea sp. 3N208]
MTSWASERSRMTAYRGVHTSRAQENFPISGYSCTGTASLSRRSA